MNRFNFELIKSADTLGSQLRGYQLPFSFPTGENGLEGADWTQVGCLESNENGIGTGIPLCEEKPLREEKPLCEEKPICKEKPLREEKPEAPL